MAGTILGSGDLSWISQEVGLEIRAFFFFTWIFFFNVTKFHASLIRLNLLLFFVSVQQYVLLEY